MNRLKYQQAYLAGPIDRVADHGITWRQDMSKFLWSLEAGVLNPCDKPTDFAQENEHTKFIIADLKQKAYWYTQHGNIRKANEYYDKIREIMKPIVAIDLRMVDIAHMVLLYVDTNIHMCGSYNEQTHACLQRKPVIICCKQGKHNVPNWLFGICHHEMMFSTWDEVKDYLKHVAFDENVEHYKRWRFIDVEKIYSTKTKTENSQ